MRNHSIIPGRDACCSNSPEEVWLQDKGGPDEFCLIDCVNYECIILIFINKVYNPKLCFHSSHFKIHLQKVCGLGTRGTSGNLKPCLNIETCERTMFATNPELLGT